MSHQKHFSDDERARIEEGIENTFGFVQDVLDDPSILDDLPERATISLVRRSGQDEEQRHAVKTHRLAILPDEPNARSRRTGAA